MCLMTARIPCTSLDFFHIFSPLMLFNSFEFLIFFLIVAFSFYLLPHRWRWLHLLIASCIFYMAFIPIYILILLFTITVDYIAGILIEDAMGPKRKTLLGLSLIA